MYPVLQLIYGMIKVVFSSRDEFCPRNVLSQTDEWLASGCYDHHSKYRQLHVTQQYLPASKSTNWISVTCTAIIMKLGFGSQGNPQHRPSMLSLLRVFSRLRLQDHHTSL